MKQDLLTPIFTIKDVVYCKKLTDVGYVLVGKSEVYDTLVYHFRRTPFTRLMTFLSSKI